MKSNGGGDLPEAESARRDLSSKLQELGQIEVRDERIALVAGLPKRDAEPPNDPRAHTGWEGEPIAPNDEERSRVEPPLVDEYCRSPIEEGLYRPTLQREVVVSGKSNGWRKVELAAEPWLDFVEAAGHLGERGALEYAQVVVDGLTLQLTQLGALLHEDGR